MVYSPEHIKKVLLVDDEDPIRLIAQIGLEDRPEWLILLASSGAEALTIANQEKPDLILLDVMMPGMDGKTALKKLRENTETAHIPVIFMTAKVQEHELKGYVDSGVIGIIAKPFDPMTLSTEIENLLLSVSK